MIKKTTSPKASKRTGRPPKVERTASSAKPACLSMDKTMADLGKLLASQTFASIDEANVFLQKLLHDNGG